MRALLGKDGLLDAPTVVAASLDGVALAVAVTDTVSWLGVCFATSVSGAWVAGGLVLLSAVWVGAAEEVLGGTEDAEADEADDAELEALLLEAELDEDEDEEDELEDYMHTFQHAAQIYATHYSRLMKSKNS